MPREHTGHSKHSHPKHKRWLHTWTLPDGQYKNQIYYILYSQRWRSSIQSAKTKPGADSGSDNQLLIAKFRLKLKKAGKTASPLRYDLNQIHYTVEVMNRFKGLVLVDRVPEELLTEVRNTVQVMTKTIPKKEKCQMAKWLSGWLIHFNVWQNPLQYCKVISLQLIKKIKNKTIYK